MADPVVMFDPVKNLAKAALTAGIDADDTTFSVTTGDGALFPDTSTDGPFNVTIYNSTNYTDPADDPDAEILRVTSRSGDTFTVTRGQEGTSATTHNNSIKIYKIVLGFTKKGYDDFSVMANTGMARQAIINGNFDIWQRGTSFTTPSNGTFTADRWKVVSTVDGGTLPTTHTHSRQVITTGSIDYSYYHHRLNVDGAGSGFGSAAVYANIQQIENGTRFLCGDGKKVTVSFYAKSSISGKKIGVALFQSYGSGGSPTSNETIDGTNWELTTTWTRYSYTFTTNTLSGKTFGTNNDDNLQIYIGYMWGSGGFASAFGDSVAEDFVGSGNIDIAQVQINTGDRPMDFLATSTEDELRKCQRYYQKSYAQGTDPGTATLVNAVLAQSPQDSPAITDIIFGSDALPVEMRTTPTLALYGCGGTSSRISIDTSTNTSAERAIDTGSVSGYSRNVAWDYYLTGTASAVSKRLFHYTLDAEL